MRKRRSVKEEEGNNGRKRWQALESLGLKGGAGGRNRTLKTSSAKLGSASYPVGALECLDEGDVGSI